MIPARTSTSPNTLPSAEIARRAPRFVVYGSRVAGVFDFADLIAEQLKQHGYSDENLTSSRYVTNIEKVFFNQQRPSSDEAPMLMLGATEQSPKPRKLLSRLGGLLARGAADSLPANATDQSPDPVDVPDAVFVFPEMRQYTSEGAGMTVPTPYDTIEGLCQEYDVRLIRVERDTTLAELTQRIDEITA